MKKLLRSLAVAVLTTISASAFSQDVRLYLAENYSTNLFVYDTTGGVYTLLETKTISGGTGVNGIYGFSLKPSTQEMYVVYSPSGGCTDRRLGILDTVTAVITDIGGPNTLQEIAFFGDELFGTTNSCGGFDFVRVDQTDGSTTVEFSHSFSGYGASILYNDYTDEGLWYFTDGGNSITQIDTTTMTETFLGSGIPGQTHDMVMKNDSVALACSSWGGSLYEVNLNTLVWTSVGSLMSAHAMAFNQSPFYVIVSGPNTFCDNENNTVLASSETGSSFQWNLDGSPISGATDSTHVPVESGMYSVVVDGDETNPVSITVLVSPIASFDAIPNPVDLGFDPSGSVDLTNTSTGGNTYHWDFGTGFTSSNEDVTYPYTTVGDYDVEFIVYDTTNGCSDTAWATITVINSTGIEELDADFEVYPTPTKDFVTVQMKGNGEYQLSVLSLAGQEVIANRTISGENTVKIDLSDLENGVYLLRIFNDEEEGYLKVIKQ